MRNQVKINGETRRAEKMLMNFDQWQSIKHSVKLTRIMELMNTYYNLK